jgi:hypothetical protein
MEDGDWSIQCDDHECDFRDYLDIFREEPGESHMKHSAPQQQFLNVPNISVKSTDLELFQTHTKKFKPHIYDTSSVLTPQERTKSDRILPNEKWNVNSIGKIISSLTNPIGKVLI